MVDIRVLFLFNIVWKNALILMKLYSDINTDQTEIWFEHMPVPLIVNRVMSVDWCQNYVLANILQTNQGMVVKLSVILLFSRYSLGLKIGQCFTLKQSYGLKYCQSMTLLNILKLDWYSIMKYYIHINIKYIYVGLKWHKIYKILTNSPWFMSKLCFSRYL